MIHRFAAKLGNSFSDIRRQRAASTMRINKDRYKCLRHAQARAASVDAKWFDAFPPDCLGERRRYVYRFHERPEFTPTLRCMRPEAFRRVKLMFRDVQPPENGSLYDVACS